MSPGHSVAVLGATVLLGCSSGERAGFSIPPPGSSTPVELPAALGGGTATTQPAKSGAQPSRHVYLPIPATWPTGSDVHVFASPSLPATVDISAEAPLVGDQGQTGSCQSWATGYSAMGWWAHHQGLGGAEFAPMYVYSQLVKGDCTTGAYAEEALGILQSQGIDTVADYQPMQTTLDCATLPSASKRANAGHFKVTGYTKNDLSVGVEQAIKSTLAAGSPAIISFAVYPEFENASSSGYLIGPPQAGEAALGGHVVSAFRYDASGVWIENQWGTGWGHSGWGILSWAFINGTHGGQANVGDVDTITGVAIACSDSNDQCAGWASGSQCQENPDYMLTQCCASCANPSLAAQTYAFHPLVDTSSCMDVYWDETANYTPLDEYVCDGTPAQAFTILGTGQGLVSLYHPQSGKCVDVEHAGTANGTPIDLYDCNGTVAQQFDLQTYSDGTVTFSNPNSGSCLDVTSANPANYTRLQLWGCNGTNAQRWAPAAP